MAENTHNAQSTKQQGNASSLFASINKETIKETQEVIEGIKEVSATVEASPTLNEGNPKPLSESVKASTPRKEVSGEINVDDTLKDDVEKKVKITFKKDSFIKDEISKKTAEAPEDAEGREPLSNEPRALNAPSQDVSEIREQLKQAEESTQNNMTASDYEMIAEFLIDTLDWGGSSLLMYIAKDKTDSPYTLQQSKKDRLKKQLTRILIKSNTKMNFTALFIISFGLAYVKPVKMAIENRKVIKKAEDELKRQKVKEIQESRQAEERKRIKEESKIVIPPKEVKPKVSNPIVIEKEVMDEVKETKQEISPTKDTVIDKKTGNVRRKRRRGNPKG